MFNTRRHRWLTVPMTVVMLAMLVAMKRPLWAFGLAPPLVVLPFVGLIALAPSDTRAYRFGTDAIQAMGWIAFAWSLLLALVTGPYGAVAACAVVPMLVPITNERRAAMLTMWLGVVGLLATIPLMWFALRPVPFGVASALLVAGGAVWMIDAHVAARDESTLPRAVVF